MTSEDGLQNERTSLAWRRTALSIAVAGATMGHVSAERSHLLGIGWTTAGILGGLLILVLAHSGYQRRNDPGLTAGSPLAVIASAFVIACFGLLAVIFVIT